jgi:hypothetical protein
MQDETTSPPSNANFAEAWNIVDILFPKATASRNKLSGSSWSLPASRVFWRHRSVTQRIIVRHIYKQCPDTRTSRTTWNNTDGTQHNQTICTRKGSHHCWPRSPIVGRYGADDGNSDTGQHKFSHYNSPTNLGPRYTFARIPRFTIATDPPALAHICGYFCFHSRNFGSPSLFAPILAQHTLSPSQNRRTSSHCMTTWPRAATSNTRTIRREFKVIYCLHVLSL